MSSWDHIFSDERTMLSAFLDEHRREAAAILDGLDEAQAREHRVASATTLLGLLKHLTFVERVWFGEAIGGVDRVDLGLPADSQESFLPGPDETIESVRAGYLEACEDSRAALADVALDAVVEGHRRGPKTVRWIMLHCIRETAQHVGHAEILREQILA